MDSIKDWAKDLKYNKKIAKKYKGVKTVKDILRLAKSDGYNFTEEELLNFNLDLVSGGSGDFWKTFHFGNNTQNINKKTNINEVHTNQDTNIIGNENQVSMSVSNNSNQN